MKADNEEVKMKTEQTKKSSRKNLKQNNTKRDRYM